MLFQIVCKANMREDMKHNKCAFAKFVTFQVDTGEQFKEKVRIIGHLLNNKSNHVFQFQKFCKLNFYLLSFIILNYRKRLSTHDTSEGAEKIPLRKIV